MTFPFYILVPLTGCILDFIFFNSIENIKPLVTKFWLGLRVFSFIWLLVFMVLTPITIFPYYIFTMIIYTIIVFIGQPRLAILAKLMFWIFLIIKFN